jgi:hypothetical protein
MSNSNNSKASSNGSRSNDSGSSSAGSSDGSNFDYSKSHSDSVKSDNEPNNEAHSTGVLEKSPQNVDAGNEEQKKEEEVKGVLDNESELSKLN